MAGITWRSTSRYLELTMPASSDSNTQAKELLEGVLRDPYVPLSTEKAQEPPTHVREWFQYLRQRFPLWAFQADEFQQFHSSALSTTYPLGQFVYSMLLDEGVIVSVPLDPLPAELEQRRLDLADPTGIQLPAWKATMLSATANQAFPIARFRGFCQTVSLHSRSMGR